jgi:hypothetical protein
MKVRIFLVLCLILLGSCTKYSIFGTKLGGTQSPIGEADNTFTTSQLAGVSGLSGVITDVTDGITTISFSANISDSKLLQLVSGGSDVKVTGKIATRVHKYRFTSEGIESVYDEGNLIMVRYSDNVGAKYTLKKGNNTITREVTSKSTTDDYFWGGLMIKTIEVEETGRNIPGITKLKFVANHKFGLVGIEFFFEDGTTKTLWIFSYNTNS